VSTLLERLETVVPGASRRTLRQMLEHGRVLVNGREARRGAEIVPDGAKVSILPKSAALAAPPVPILFEDEHLLVAAKPAGLLSVSTREEGRESLWSSLRKMLRLRGKGEKIHLVHRLDEKASGILAFAKSESAKKAMKVLFERHDIERRYAAIVEGKFEESSGELRNSLVEMDEPRHRVRSVTARDSASVKKASRYAHTRYTVLAAASGLTALALKIETGRKHQIRVHLAEAGHPVLGDTLYGGSSAPRLYLHAWVLGFVHPVTKAPLRFVSSPGKDFNERFRGVFEKPPQP
jgi:23S rRNA pseudouridine1911/1915/1917 synthase